MKSILNLSVLCLLLVASASPCFAMMEIEVVSKERAKQLGMEVRATAAGPDAVRVELAFEAKGELKEFGRVDLEITSGGKLLLSSTLREERSKPGRVVVSFAADRASLDKVTVRVVVSRPVMGGTGYDLPMKDFVDVAKVR